MEIDIQSKTNNPLLKRTEVRFIIHHEGEGTPKSELVKTELAERLNVKKENIMINYMKASFGITDTIGYAKVYNSIKEAKAYEKKYILKRNNILVEEEKPPKKEEKPKEETVEKPKEERPEEPKEKTAEKPSEEGKEGPEKTEEKKSEEDVKKPEEEEKSTDKKE
ncbi:MAG: 30S ribosomal protein S24e [Petrotogales bacterium]